jgi:HEAT repeats
MNRLLIALSAWAAASGTAAGAADLSAQLAEADGWVAWRVPMIADAGTPCCYSQDDHSSSKASCDLDGRNGNFTTDGQSVKADATLSVYLRVAHGHVDRVRAFASSCPVTSATTIRWVDTVEPAQSVMALSDWIDGAPKSDEDDALAALAYHADVSATHALATLAGPAHSGEPRKEALFWLGQTRGADGAELVEHYATTDADPDFREHAIFVLTQSHAGDSYAKILAISRSDPADHVRSQALFWMAQTQDARAAPDITATLASESSADVREQAVFALSQLKDGRAEDALIAVVRGTYPREVKKQALFWLGQSGSPRALKALDDVLAKTSGSDARSSN